MKQLPIIFLQQIYLVHCKALLQGCEKALLQDLKPFCRAYLANLAKSLSLSASTSALVAFRFLQLGSNGSTTCWCVFVVLLAWLQVNAAMSLLLLQVAFVFSTSHGDGTLVNEHVLSASRRPFAGPSKLLEDTVPVPTGSFLSSGFCVSQEHRTRVSSKSVRNVLATRCMPSRRAATTTAQQRRSVAVSRQRLLPLPSQGNPSPRSKMSRLATWHCSANAVLEAASGSCGLKLATS